MKNDLLYNIAGSFTSAFNGIINLTQVSQVRALVKVRKVRTPQSRMPGNTWEGVSFRIGPQKHTARKSKVEKVV